MMSSDRNTRLLSSIVPARTRGGLVAALLATSSLLTACAGTAPMRGDSASEDLVYTVMQGDRLGEIARETTGNADHWRAIAAVNGIDDPRTLRAGAALVIPARLLPSDSPALARQVTLAQVDVNRRFELTPLDGSHTRVARLPATKPVRVTEKADPASAVVVTRITATEKRRESAVTMRDGQSGIRVVGSYFPKGIYAQPASYSRLMMRVAPGTVFPLERTVGDWYEVRTAEGVGYLRDIDGKPVDREQGAQLTLAEASEG